ncbi:MAG: hypothetical protein KDK38_15640 [Leptospiraceae bacterium]|nr:hypothetical protein [Leptospiraceae bacterium]
MLRPPFIVHYKRELTSLHQFCEDLRATKFKDSYVFAANDLDDKPADNTNILLTELYPASPGSKNEMARAELQRMRLPNVTLSDEFSDWQLYVAQCLQITVDNSELATVFPFAVRSHDPFENPGIRYDNIAIGMQLFYQSTGKRGFIFADESPEEFLFHKNSNYFERQADGILQVPESTENQNPLEYKSIIREKLEFIGSEFESGNLDYIVMPLDIFTGVTNRKLRWAMSLGAELHSIAHFNVQRDIPILFTFDCISGTRKERVSKINQLSMILGIMASPFEYLSKINDDFETNFLKKTGIVKPVK